MSTLGTGCLYKVPEDDALLGIHTVGETFADFLAVDVGWGHS